MNVILKIVDMTDDGRGIGKTEENFTVFVDSCLPGDTVEAEIYKRKKNFAEANLVKIISYSEDRIENKCETPSDCGGCDFMEYSYPAQLALKERKVRNLLSRISSIDADINDIKHGESSYNYRNKAVLHVDEDSIGYYSKKSNDTVNMINCLINSRVSVEIKKFLSELIKKYKIRDIENILIRNSKRDKEIMVVFISPKEKIKNIDKITEELVNKFPNIKSVMLNVNKNNRFLLGRKSEVLYGRNYIVDYIKDMKFKISPETFFQVNADVTEIMYDTVLKYADLKENDTVFNIYSGIGTISLFLAQKAEKVIGIEYVQKSVENAAENAEINGIENTEFIAGKAEEILPKFDKKGTKADVIVVDPPRKGCDRNVLSAMVNMNPRTIVYVSCNPATFARDLGYLADNGYEVKRVQPLDMFSHTTHVENVALIERV